jgi:hypothetical protein
MIKRMTEQKIKDNFPKIIPLDIVRAELRYLEPTFENAKKFLTSLSPIESICFHGYHLLLRI